MWAESQEASATQSGVARVGLGIWVPGCGAEHPKEEQQPHKPTWLQAVHTTLGYQVWHCSLWGEQGLPVPGASFHSCRGSNTVAASPVSSLLLLVFLGAERWECAQLEGWQPALLSFLLSLSHPPTPLLQHPAQGQGWGWGSHPADVQGGGVSWRLPQAPRVPWCCLVEREGGCGPGSWRSC